MADQGFTLSSPAFQFGGAIPMRFTGDGANVSPELNWLHPPPETQSFALIVDDPDAPKGTFTHWVLFDIPATQHGLAEGAKGVGTDGTNDFQYDHYGGPLPPPNHGDHRYFFKLHALDVPSLNLKQGARRDAVEEAMRGHILGQTELMGLYQRRTGNPNKL